MIPSSDDYKIITPLEKIKTILPDQKKDFDFKRWLYSLFQPRTRSFLNEAIGFESRGNCSWIFDLTGKNVKVVEASLYRNNPKGTCCCHCHYPSSSAPSTTTIIVIIRRGTHTHYHTHTHHSPLSSIRWVDHSFPCFQKNITQRKTIYSVDCTQASILYNYVTNSFTNTLYTPYFNTPYSILYIQKIHYNALYYLQCPLLIYYNTIK